MIVLDIITLVLLGTSGVFSIIELGLSAYVVSIGSVQAYEYWDPNYDGTGYGGYQFGIRKGAAPGEVDFLLFCSLWTLLLASALIILSIVWASKSRIAGKDIHSVFGPLTLALNAITMVMWLAGFAALANLYGGVNPQGILGALLAFPILLWLIFLALLIVNILTACGILKSERLGYNAIFTKHGSSNVVQTNDAPSSTPRQPDVTENVDKC